MAKNTKAPKANAGAQVERTERYAEKVRLMFAQTVREMLALRKTTPDISKGVMYSFDGDTQKVQSEVERLLRRLHSIATMAIQKGIELEWTKANDECDKLVSSAFGKRALDKSSKFNAYTQRNAKAMQAFISRSDAGMNLSDRVWRSVRRLRDEMEVALTVSIGEGASSQEISQSVRKYLNDPDLMFRRFRYKDENGNWQRKWKKRYKDEATGKYRWMDYDRDSYIPKRARDRHIPGSQGVYKSSAKNAMRVARTETNMAYRNADWERWQQMDFVLGIHIEPSKHTKKKREEDICDKLSGDYPKSFKFEGWHPQCRCVVTPMVPSDEELIAEAEARGRGEKYEYKQKPIKDFPDNFKSWVSDNEHKILQSRDYGTEPYFLAHNRKAIDGILKGNTTLTPLDIAKQRHDARTPEQIAEIKKKVAERAKQNRLIKTNANNFISVAKDYGEVDYSTLQKYITSNDLMAMEAETKKLGQTILETRKQEQALSDIIPDAHGWHKKFTMAELQGVHSSVKDKLSQWGSLEVGQKIKKLNFEAFDYLGGNMREVQQRYKTWEVSQSAYLKSMKETSEEWMLDLIRKNDIESASDASDFYAKSVLAFADKRYKTQSDVINPEQIKIAEDNLKKYLTEKSFNPIPKGGYIGIWGGNIGGVYHKKRAERQILASELNDVTADELSIITRFTGGMTFYNAFNLRNQSAYWKETWESKMRNLSEEDKIACERVIDEYTKALNGTINKMKRYEGIVYRGVHDDGGVELLSQFQNAWSSKSKIWVNTAAASSSTSIRVSYYTFDNKGYGDLIMVIRNKTGAYIRPISEFDYEKEVLLMKDTQYKVLKEPYKLKGKWFVELEEI